MRLADTKYEHTPQRGDVLVYLRNTGTLSYSTKKGEIILWGDDTDDKILTILKDVFKNRRKKVDDTTQKDIIQTIGLVVAKILGLTDCKVILDDNSRIVVELI